MTGTTFIANAFCLPKADLDALCQGRMIAALPWSFLTIGQSFALFPETEHPEEVRARFWARCEFCKSIDTVDFLEILSQITIWDRSYLESQYNLRGFLFLAGLRVYELPEPAEVIPTGKGAFLPLKEPSLFSNPLPVLSDRAFAQRKKQLEELRPPEHPELENLQRKLSNISPHLPEARSLDLALQCFLGWSDRIETNTNYPEWMEKISALGHRSDETAGNEVSNYQAGTAFEIVVRNSLEQLGFKVDEAHKGGAGGIDIFCSAPYDLVGECKSGKGIPDNTAEQLARIAKRHLKEKYESATRLIIGPGQPSRQLLESASISKISIMSPETLEKLVKFNHRYPIDLLDFKQKCLIAGQIDTQIEQYLETIHNRIAIRAQIIQLVKQCQENIPTPTVDTTSIHTAYAFAKPSQSLGKSDIQEILIELSSPLVGYLGRCKGADGSDRFYFLRPLTYTPPA